MQVGSPKKLYNHMKGVFILKLFHIPYLPCLQKLWYFSHLNEIPCVRKIPGLILTLKNGVWRKTALSTLAFKLALTPAMVYS